MATDILEKAKRHHEKAKSGWSEILTKARDDLHFLSDEPYAQWDAQEANARVIVGRPVLEVDQLSQFIHQVVNDIRMNTPAIKVIPEGEGSDIETAEVISGRIKAIEYKSNADSAYDLAAEFAVKSSIGYIRVDHDYINDSGFDQELKIGRVINPCAVLIDPDSIEPDGCDAKYGFVLDEMTKEEFVRLYPDATPCSFGDDSAKNLKDDDKITIAEYFVIDETIEERGMLEDGKAEKFDGRKKYKRTRKVRKPKVLRYKLSGEDILEETTFPGRYIPIVPVYGEEAWIEGKRKLHSLIRKSKSSQKAYNMLKSSETEILLKQQQAPVQAAVGQMRGFEEDWKKPEKAMVLYYHQTDANGQAAPAPQRLNPPVVSSGFANASLDAENNIRKTLGMYNAGVGKREGQSSGIALKQLERSGDMAAFHFGDNLIRSIAHVGKILVYALPEVEDTARVVNTINSEDEHKMVGINGAMVEGQDRTYNLTGGTWGVRVIAGPSFTTQRQEAAEYYAEVIRSAPDLMPVIGDLVFKYQDAPGSQAISTRLKKLVDPKFLDENERDKDQGDPAVMQMQQQLQEAMQVMQQMKAELDNKQGDQMIKQAELQIKAKEAEIKEMELKVKLVEAQRPEAAAPGDSFDKAAKMRELEIKEYEAETKRMQAMQKSEPAAASPAGIKVDSTGFQFMKTPEQEALEAQEAERRAMVESEELQLKQVELQQRQAQADTIANALTTIAAQVNQLNANVAKPIVIQRDENGNMIGAA